MTDARYVYFVAVVARQMILAQASLRRTCSQQEGLMPTLKGKYVEQAERPLSRHEGQDDKTTLFNRCVLASSLLSITVTDSGFHNVFNIAYLK